MPSPFPGMDPYLEGPTYWPGFHAKFIVHIFEAVTGRLPPGYYAEVEQHVWLEDEAGDDRHPFAIPDTYVADDESGGAAVATRKTKKQAAPALEVTLPKLKARLHKYVKVVEQTGNRVITVIELLSPSNKTGEDREQYLLKRAEFFAAKVHLVELDLLRDGTRMPFGKPKPPPADYYALVCRGHPKASVWAWTVRDPLPELPIPLKPADGDIELDLKACLDRTYDGAGYQKRIRYDQPPESPLRVADAEWATEKVLPKAPR